ncbi:NAD(P)H dehydrogenase (quinone) [Lunatimonas lonarensis]|uniref:NAD(P)H dehydrogenase (Quinone) n=1 Tax=Lunatimonas lonarensis TaxID=1232681 RepID=R7ZPT2_9BACT|nr:NAD(P)H-dependent oxidoreductase [Lunatimonas lonarensis]EON76034.1 NAD(P)H dehydrogenase (quinone) [Lunatimonas lonarensis]
MKKIVIINGHPNRESFNFGLAKAYKEGAMATGAEIKELIIADLKFNPNLEFGYQKRTELEPDLLAAWETIQWAEHLVWVHPVWWGGLPAIMKGFIDRLFLPGFAFQYREKSLFWDKLLKGKSARIITTLDQPGWIYRLLFGRPSVNQLKKSTLQYCGVNPVNVTYVGIVRTSNAKKRDNWLKKAKRLGERQK